MIAQIRNNRDLLAGLLFVIVGIVAFWLARNYRFGTSSMMGPGYFPGVLSGVLIMLGLIVGARGLRAPAAITERISFRGLLALTIGVLFFAVTVRRLGFVPALVGLVVISAMARPGAKPGETIALTVGITLLLVVIIIWGLGMPYPLFGKL